MSRLRLAGTRPTMRTRLATRYPWLLRDSHDLSFIDSYDLLIANSAYTQDWIERLWQAKCEILYPPIEVGGIQPRGEDSARSSPSAASSRPGMGIPSVSWRWCGCSADSPGRGTWRGGSSSYWAAANLSSGRTSMTSPVLRRVCLSRSTRMHRDRSSRHTCRARRSSGPQRGSAKTPTKPLDERALRDDDRRGNGWWMRPGRHRPRRPAGDCARRCRGFRWNSDEQWRIRTVQVATNDALRARLAASATERVRSSPMTPLPRDGTSSRLPTI